MNEIVKAMLWEKIAIEFDDKSTRKESQVDDTM